jgi:integrase
VAPQARTPTDIAADSAARLIRRYLTHEQVARLAEAVGQQGDVVLFLAYTGLRWGEMAALRVDRLDMLRRRLDVASAMTEPPGVVTWGTPKTHERRSGPFPAFLTPLLAQRCAGKTRDELVLTTAEMR